MQTVRHWLTSMRLVLLSMLLLFGLVALMAARSPVAEALAALTGPPPFETALAIRAGEQVALRFPQRLDLAGAAHAVIALDGQPLGIGERPDVLIARFERSVTWGELRRAQARLTLDAAGWSATCLVPI